MSPHLEVVGTAMIGLDVDQEQDDGYDGGRQRPEPLAALEVERRNPGEQ